MTARRRVLYSGRVQGVGFRWTSQTIAERHAVSGWVRNLPDGRVEMVVEGELPAVQGYLSAVSDHFGRKIRERQVLEEQPEGLAGPLRIAFL